MRASAGLRWGAFNQGTQQVVRLAVQVVLTKLLAPSDFGAMALALVVINVGTLIGALGFAQALVQRQQITRRHVDVAFTTSGLVGPGPDDRRLRRRRHVRHAGSTSPTWRPLLRVLSVMFLLRGFEGVPNAMLVRRLYIRDFVLSSTIATVGGRRRRHRHGGRRRRPVVAGRDGRHRVVRRHQPGVDLRHPGRGVATAAVARTSPRCGICSASAPPPAARACSLVAQGSIDSIVVGRQLGTDALGQYSLGYRFLFLPLDRLLDAIGGVLEPVLATLQDDKARFQDTLLRVERYVCALYVPLTLGHRRRRPRPRRSWSSAPSGCRPSRRSRSCR